MINKISIGKVKIVSSIVPKTETEKLTANNSLSQFISKPEWIFLFLSPYNTYVSINPN